jgi:hypothetical protein
MAGGMINYVKIIETKPPEVTVRKWREIRHGVMRAMGNHWHQNMLPLHFAPNAGSVYSYKERTRLYLQAKSWRLAKGRGITQQDVIAEMKRMIPRRSQNRRGFGEEWFWKEYQDTRELMLERAGSGRDATSLFYSGALRANVTQVATIRSFENRFKLVMPGTPYTPDRPRNPHMPPIAQEVTKLLEREKQELAKLGKAHAIAALKALKETKITNIN